MFHLKFIDENFRGSYKFCINCKMLCIWFSLRRNSNNNGNGKNNNATSITTKCWTLYKHWIPFQFGLTSIMLLHIQQDNIEMSNDRHEKRQRVNVRDGAWERQRELLKKLLYYMNESKWIGAWNARQNCIRCFEWHSICSLCVRLHVAQNQIPIYGVSFLCVRLFFPFVSSWVCLFLSACCLLVAGTASTQWCRSFAAAITIVVDLFGWFSISSLFFSFLLLGFKPVVEKSIEEAFVCLDL